MSGNADGVPGVDPDVEQTLTGLDTLLGSREIVSPEAMERLGEQIGRMLRPGDLVVLTGPLGAGKTTLTRGIARGLEVRGPVQSPTFVLARTHPSLVGGTPLVHVDAYRLGSMEELDALDLDAGLEESVTVVEWGEGLVEVLADDRLEVVIERPHGGLAPVGDVLDAEVGVRRVTVTGVGPRWAGVELPTA